MTPGARQQAAQTAAFNGPTPPSAMVDPPSAVVDGVHITRASESSSPDDDDDELFDDDSGGDDYSFGHPCTRAAVASQENNTRRITRSSIAANLRE